VSLHGALGGKPDVAVGNVVGSNISNVLLILGCSALAAPLVVQHRLLWVDVPVMVGVSLATFLLALDGRLGPVDGGLLFAGLVTYVTFTVVQSRRARAAVRKQYADEFRDRPPPRAGPTLGSVGLALLGLGALVLGSHWLVESAVTMATVLGVSDLVVSLTVIAVGTSLPELATSIVAALRGERDIAVGNAIGSNLFTLLAVLGLTAVVAPGGLAVSASVLRFDMPVMLAVAVACLPVFFAGHRIARWEGALFVGYYAVYVAVLALAATDSAALGPLATATWALALPLTAVTLGVVCFREWRAGGRGRGPGGGGRGQSQLTNEPADGPGEEARPR